MVRTDHKLSKEKLRRVAKGFLSGALIGDGADGERLVFELRMTGLRATAGR